MQRDIAILGFLGRAVSLEFSAVQQYVSLAKWLEIQGMAPIGQKFTEQSTDSLKQIERIIGRMMALGVAPNSSQCRPVHLKGTLPEKMKQTLEQERELAKYYSLAVLHCTRNDDHENRLFFELIHKEKQQRVAAMEQWMSQLFGQVQPQKQKGDGK